MYFRHKNNKGFNPKRCKNAILFENWKHIGCKVFRIYFFGPTLSDVGCTYKVISRNAYEKIKNELRVIGSEFQPELMIRLIQKKFVF